jgi:hypothetical protein
MGETLGICEGDVCNRSGCCGSIELRRAENCSCHLSAPCGACTAPRHFCADCGWEEADDPVEYVFNDHKVTEDRKTGQWLSWKPRELDPTKIDYRIREHTHFSQICDGVYPEGTTSKEVEDRVKGTFGGRFLSFGGGKFQYVAYTD